VGIGANPVTEADVELEADRDGDVVLVVGLERIALHIALLSGPSEGRKISVMSLLHARKSPNPIAKMPAPRGTANAASAMPVDISISHKAFSHIIFN
jgi:hypothetical protein